jgi:pyruvate dehydrogenase E1 component alpha subunit
MVAKWELPVVYVVENNSYGMGTDIDRVAAVDELFTRACAYQGKKAEQVDGMDVLAVYDATMRAVKRARETSRPTFIEARTYRFFGHSMSDPAHGTYRTREEVQAERDNDPINSLAERMEEAGILTDEEYQKLNQEIIDEVEQAAEFAENSPVPGADEIYAHVYADEFRGGLQRRDAWR